MQPADTPGSTPREYGRVGQRPLFTLTDELDHAESDALSPTMPHGHQAVFNLDLDDSEDDALLDWEQYAAMKRVKFCGIDCTRVASCLPCIPRTPPQWWYTYTRSQRRLILITAAVLAVLGVLLAAVIAVAVLRAAWGGKDSQGGDQSGLSAELCSWQQFRLPGGVLPQQYNLSLQVQLEDPFLVEGRVDILLNISQPDVRCVVLHASDNIQLLEARVGGKDGKRVTWRYDQELEQVTLVFNDPVPQSDAWVHLDFQYPLREGLSGFYRSTYTLSDGKERSLATTQFEASSARKAFPCFDEPAMKAVFVVSIECARGLTALSNMPTASVHQHEEGEATFHFQPTPPMSPYLVAFVVGDLASVSRAVPHPSQGGMDRAVSVWGTPDRVNSLEFAAGIAAAILPAYEGMLGVPYSLPKLDLVAIPDFAAGAMENWGLVTYRETALLTSPTSNIFDYRYVAKVIAHEMAHLWFGDLVTMDFWGELWLNEGFASYFEFAGATAALPEQDFFATYYPSDVPSALFYDSKESSHPLAVLEGINSTDQVESFFDPVMYEKGGGVLRMLRAWVNRRSMGSPTVPDESALTTPQKDPFLAGLQQYLSQYKYGTATSAQLWASLAGPLDMPGLEERMRAWTYQQGYPLVTVTADDSGAVYVQQSSFTLRGPSPCDSSTAWWVPLAFTTSSTPGGTREWTQLEGCVGQQPITKLRGKGDWVKVNAGQYGLFRVQYDRDLWRRLVAAVASGSGESGGGAQPQAPTLSEVDVAGLVEDSWALAEAGELNITVFLDLVSAVQQRGGVQYSPWSIALPYLHHMYTLVPCPSQWQQYMGGILLAGLVGQGDPGSNSTQGGGGVRFSFAPPGGAVWPVEAGEVGYRLLRPLLLKEAGYFANNHIKGEALNLMGRLEDDPSGTHIDNDVRMAVYATAAHSNDAEIYQQLKEMYLEAESPDERERLLLSLAYAGQGGHIMATLDFALQPEVRAQDVRSLVVRVAREAYTKVADSRQITWTWLKLHWGELHGKLGGDDEASRRMGQIMEGLASGFADLAYLQEVEDMFEKHKEQQQEAGYAQRAKESIEANARWVARHGEGVCSWVQAALGR